MWAPMRKRHGKVPWGYDIHPDDPMLLVPDRNALKLLDEAKTWLRIASIREVAEWLSKKSGRPISHTGLRDRIDREEGGKLVRVRDMIQEDIQEL